MSKANARTRRGGRWWAWALALVAAVLVGLFAWYRAPIAGYTETSVAYAARVGCSCRFVGGRSLEDCEKDRLEGMELVGLSEDAEAKSVTASFPLLASDTASYREGYGCVLDPYEG